MTDSSAGTGGSPPAPSILGPAVPPRGGAREAAPALHGSLGPFVPGGAARQQPPEPVQEQERRPEPIHKSEPEPRPAPEQRPEAALTPEPGAAQAGEPAAAELPWLSVPEEVTPADLEEPASGDESWSHGWDEPVQRERGEERAGTAASPFDDSGSHQPSGEVLEEIAARLERIARALRSRTGDDFGGDAGDPLEVLITGYALGYSDGLRRGGREGE